MCEDYDDQDVQAFSYAFYLFHYFLHNDGLQLVLVCPNQNQIKYIQHGWGPRTFPSLAVLIHQVLIEHYDSQIQAHLISFQTGME